MIILIIITIATIIIIIIIIFITVTITVVVVMMVESSPKVHPHDLVKYLGFPAKCCEKGVIIRRALLMGWRFMDASIKALAKGLYSHLCLRMMGRMNTC